MKKLVDNYEQQKDDQFIWVAISDFVIYPFQALGTQQTGRRYAGRGGTVPTKSPDYNNNSCE